MLVKSIKACLSMLVEPQRLEGRSWKAELMCRAMRATIEEAQTKDIPAFRQVIEKSVLPSPLISKVEFADISLGGVPCSMAHPSVNNDDADKTVIIYLHGGGYVFGSTNMYKGMIAALALEANALVIAADYRLAPEHPFPVPQDDCLNVVKACLAKYPNSKVCVVGDSAGGALAISSALQLAGDDSDLPAIDSLVLISPWVSPIAKGGSIISNAKHDFLLPKFLLKSYEALMQGASDADPRINFTKADLSTLPRTLVQCGTGELFFDQIQNFVASAKQQQAKIELENYTGQFHVFQILTPHLEEAEQAVSKIAKFINQ